MGNTYGPRLEFNFPSGEDYAQAIVQAAEISSYPGVASLYRDEKAELRSDIREALEEALEESLEIEYPKGVSIDRVRREGARVKVSLSSTDTSSND